MGTDPRGSVSQAATTCPQEAPDLAASQRPVAASREGLGAVIRGVDDHAVPVVSVLPQGVGDVSHRLVHRGHHGGQLSSGDVRHVAVRVDVRLGGLERSVNRLENKEPNDFFSFISFLVKLSSRSNLEGQKQEEGSFRGVVALQDLSSSLCEERGGVFALLAPHHALAVMEIVAADSWAVAGQVTVGGGTASSRTRR